MSLAAALTDFRIRATDTVAPYLWPNTEVLPWFAEAEAEAAIRAKLIRDADEITVAIGETTIDLPSKLFDIQYAELRDAAGNVYEITGTSRLALDKERPGWRRRNERPTTYVHDDKTLTFGASPDMAYTLYLEFFRTPANPVASKSDEFEIHEVHHMHLVDWVLHKAYSKPDADTLNPGKAAESEAAFERQFGKRPGADLRRRQNANRPHRNAIHT